jgi:hypothetical protein
MFVVYWPNEAATAMSEIAADVIRLARCQTIATRLSERRQTAAMMPIFIGFLVSIRAYLGLTR